MKRVSFKNTEAIKVKKDLLQMTSEEIVLRVCHQRGVDDFSYIPGGAGNSKKT